MKKAAFISYSLGGRQGVINMNSAAERHERLGGVLNYYDRRAA
jgi:hypothetical protein